VAPSRAARVRHRRKYALGELGTDKSFYFRGPAGQLNLRAQNLMLFMHRWFSEAIKDDDLAAIAVALEAHADLSPAAARQRLKEAIEQRYTLPSTSS
jgi:hypothetical protein